MRYIHYFLLILVFIIVLSFALLNWSIVRVNLYFYQFSLPLAITLIITMVLCLLIGFLFGYLSRKSA